MKDQIKKLEKQIIKLNKQFTILKDMCYNNIKENKKELIMSNQKNQINIFDVANYIIEYSTRNNIKDLTNLKLQKIMFYIYSFFLVQNGKKETLFKEHIEAWPYGPVFPTLYFEFYRNGNKKIKKTTNGDENKLEKNIKLQIDKVLEKYAKLKAWELTRKTHSEDPWWDCYKNIEDFQQNIIKDKDILEYYSQNSIL